MAKAKKAKRSTGRKSKKRAPKRKTASRKRKSRPTIGNRIAGAVQAFASTVGEMNATRRKMKNRVAMDEG
jgi:hypothetical protein